MTVFELGALGEFLGSLAVLITLIVLIYQISQNTQSIDASRKVAMYQSRAQAAYEMTLRFAESGHLPQILEKLEEARYPNDPNSLSVLNPIESRQWRSWLVSQQIQIDNQLYQYQQGLIDDEYYNNNFKSQVAALGPGWKLFAVQRRPSFDVEIDEVLAVPEK